MQKIEPKPLTKEQLEHLAIGLANPKAAANTDFAASWLEHVAAAEAYWREAMKKCQPYWGESSYCSLCGERSAFEGDPHKPDCPWKLASES